MSKRTGGAGQASVGAVILARGNVDCIVFSRDRPLQLEACLLSLQRYASAPHTTLSVLYRATDGCFRRGYEELQEARPDVTWIAEANFRDDLLAAVGREEQTVFHTDDDVFFACVGQVPLTDDLACFTLRLGLNTTYCYPLDLHEQLVEPRIEGEVVSWLWRDQALGAYSYPLALNGHVFRTSEVRGWLERSSFGNPNELESALQAYGDELPPRMASFRHSRVVSIPANIVNETFANRHADAHSAAELNERFLRGERIDLEAMDFSHVTACHQEIPFVFSPAGRCQSSRGRSTDLQPSRSSCNLWSA